MVSRVRNYYLIILAAVVPSIDSHSVMLFRLPRFRLIKWGFVMFRAPLYVAMPYESILPCCCDDIFEMMSKLIIGSCTWAVIKWVDTKLRRIIGFFGRGYFLLANVDTQLCDRFDPLHLLITPRRDQPSTIIPRPDLHRILITQI